MSPIPGIIWVNSDVISPSLTASAFDAWYMEEHIPDVVSLSGIPSAARYRHLVTGPSSPRKLKFLTIYQLPDLRFMETKEFKGLEGQREGPNRETIFEKAEFDTRAYRTVQVDAPRSSAPSAKYLLCAAMSHSNDEELDEWYRGEHLQAISKCPGYVRTTRCTLESRSVLSAFVRQIPEGKENLKWLALHEFEGPEIPWPQLAATDETEWAKRIIPGITAMDFGIFELVETWGEDGKAKL
ncbi:hypothetical protein B0O99DRAFT_691798 [Bisporella sp. PMI_857]|nr:hypothetical protein B0O99DRAFT_691798 [Bisporella sp. PMI_857]